MEKVDVMVEMPKKIVTAISMPAGSYWVGDPCYASRQANWSEYCSSSECFEDPVATADDGSWVVGLPTMYGDGVFSDGWGREYPVDAGLIGLVPAEFAEVGEDGKVWGAHLVTFEHSFMAAVEGSVIRFGPIEIETGDVEEDEEDEFGEDEFGADEADEVEEEELS